MAESFKPGAQEKKEKMSADSLKKQRDTLRADVEHMQKITDLTDYTSQLMRDGRVLPSKEWAEIFVTLSYEDKTTVLHDLNETYEYYRHLDPASDELAGTAIGIWDDEAGLYWQRLQKKHLATPKGTFDIFSV